ncbi:MAG: hypothetical protein KF709_07900 [Gemmatimonadaceae bacterium]|nr:hypothetical protein [Gemmatimonadaceae bacterium]
MLRLFDEWMQSGGLVAAPEFPSHAAATRAIDRIPGDEESRLALGRVAEAITMLHEPDAQPVLPRVYALGALLEQRGRFAEAADVYTSVCRFVDVRAHFDLAFDAFMRQGFCLRNMGEFEQASRAYSTAGMHAGRMRDRVRVLESRIGEAKVQWGRGDLPGADASMLKIASEAVALGAPAAKVVVATKHDRAGIARNRGDLKQAVRLAFEAFQQSTTDYARERVLGDLGNFLGLTGAFDTARAALTLLVATANQQETKWIAEQNLMDLAIREGSEPRFVQHRRALEKAKLPTKTRLTFMRDVGKGLVAFGHLDEAEAPLRSALELAARIGAHQTEFELEGMLADLSATRRALEASRPARSEAPPDIASEIENLLASVGVAV